MLSYHRFQAPPPNNEGTIFIKSINTEHSERWNAICMCEGLDDDERDSVGRKRFGFSNFLKLNKLRGKTNTHLYNVLSRIHYPRHSYLHICCLEIALKPVSLVGPPR